MPETTLCKRTLGSMRRPLVALAALTLIASTLTACSDDSYTEICVDQRTDQRVMDANCGQNMAVVPYYYWMYYPETVYMPAYGYRIPAGGVRTMPRSARLGTYRPPAAGGSRPKTSWGGSRGSNTGSRTKSYGSGGSKGSGGSYGRSGGSYGGSRGGSTGGGGRR